MLQKCMLKTRMVHTAHIQFVQKVCISSEKVHSKWISSESTLNCFTDNPIPNLTQVAGQEIKNE